MTSDEQRIAIAQACPKLACKNIYGQPVWIENQSRFFDPLYDLNAMREVEEVMTTQQTHDYYERLELACGWEYVSATAAQRAEAFLRTLNLWTTP